MIVMLKTQKNPIVGMIVPPAGTKVPPEPSAMYPEGVKFIAEGLGLERLTPDGYDAVIDRVGDVSQTLKGRGADAISLMGTSLSFYKGVEFNRKLVEIIKLATGLPAMTMSDAIVEALRAVGATNIAVGTAYVSSVNDRLRNFLEVSEFNIGGIESMDIENVKDILGVNDNDIMQLGDRVNSRTPDADAMFLSCGGLKTERIVSQLEARYQKPVITSATAGAWAAVRMIGLNGKTPGFGRLGELNHG
jgi:arylmalonate decarboxylase